MLSEEQLQEIRNHLNNSQNPLFFFDNDPDGLSSFLLLRRFSEKGKGIAIKSFPDLSVSYARKISELNPDYIFILDKPLISEGFIKEANQLNIPIVWIDHHEVTSKTEVTYSYNPTKSVSKSSEPVTYWCYQATNRKQDLWIALAGCIGDGFLPQFSNEAAKLYPELWHPVNSAFEGLYETELGKIVRTIGFGLKDRTSNVVKMLRYLTKVKSPNEILAESSENRQMLARFNQVNSKYQKLLKKAESLAGKEEMLFFQYSGDLSISAEIANELSYKFPEKIVIVAYIKGTRANISIRGKRDVKEITLSAIKGLENATGGGHKNATGAQVNVEDLPKFKENILRMIK